MTSVRGQVLPLALVMILVMTFLWITLLNTGKLIKDRIQLQVAADTAVQSACAVRARALNSIGLMNAWLGVPGLGIGAPHMAWWPVPPHRMGPEVTSQKVWDMAAAVKALRKLVVSGIKEGDAVHALLIGLLQGLTGSIGLAYDTHPKPTPDYAERQKHFVHVIQDLQTAYARSYGGGVAFWRAQEVARRQGADDIFVPPRSFSLGLERNHGSLWYLSTLHIWFKGRPLPPAPSVPDEKNMEDGPDTIRWYQQGPRFHQKAMRLYAFRRPTSPFNGPFPLGRNLFKVEAPYLYTVAAARVFNPKGPMFPAPRAHESELEGVRALIAYYNADEWRTQLVPVGAPYDH